MCHTSYRRTSDIRRIFFGCSKSKNGRSLNIHWTSLCYLNSCVTRTTLLLLSMKWYIHVYYYYLVFTWITVLFLFSFWNKIILTTVQLYRRYLFRLRETECRICLKSFIKIRYIYNIIIMIWVVIRTVYVFQATDSSFFTRLELWRIFSSISVLPFLSFLTTLPLFEQLKSGRYETSQDTIKIISFLTSFEWNV